MGSSSSQPYIESDPLQCIIDTYNKADNDKENNISLKTAIDDTINNILITREFKASNKLITYDYSNTSSMSNDFRIPRIPDEFLPYIEKRISTLEYKECANCDLLYAMLYRIKSDNNQLTRNENARCENALNEYVNESPLAACIIADICYSRNEIAPAIMYYTLAYELSNDADLLDLINKIKENKHKKIRYRIMHAFK